MVSAPELQAQGTPFDAWVSSLAEPPPCPDAPVFRNLALPCPPHFWQVESNHAKLVTHARCPKCGMERDFPAMFVYRAGVRPVEAVKPSGSVSAKNPEWVSKAKQPQKDRLAAGAAKVKNGWAKKDMRG